MTLNCILLASLFFVYFLNNIFDLVNVSHVFFYFDIGIAFASNSNRSLTIISQSVPNKNLKKVSDIKFKQKKYFAQ